MKQYLRNAAEGFDERKYGFASLVDLLRAASKTGLLRMERDRQGAVRVFAGNGFQAAAVQSSFPGLPSDESLEAEEAAYVEQVSAVVLAAEVAAEPPIIEAEVTASEEEPEVPARAGGRKKKTAGTAARKKTRSTPQSTARPRSRKTAKKSDATT